MLDAEGLADKTIDRLVRKLPTLTPEFLASFTETTTAAKDSHAAYCYRISRITSTWNTCKTYGSEEGLLTEIAPLAVVEADEQDAEESRFNCLDRAWKPYLARSGNCCCFISKRKSRLRWSTINGWLTISVFRSMPCACKFTA
ncbi:MAG: hypothetical protein U0X75_10820 [Acidobacteriota bacterium]